MVLLLSTDTGALTTVVGECLRCSPAATEWFAEEGSVPRQGAPRLLARKRRGSVGGRWQPRPSAQLRDGNATDAFQNVVPWKSRQHTRTPSTQTRRHRARQCLAGYTALRYLATLELSSLVCSKTSCLSGRQHLFGWCIPVLNCVFGLHHLGLWSVTHRFQSGSLLCNAETKSQK